MKQKSHFCSVKDCKHTSESSIKNKAQVELEANGNIITFHPFPLEKDRLFKWKKAINRVIWKVKPYNRVCSVHFREDEIIRLSDREAYLVPDAIPSLLIPPTKTQVLAKQKAEKLAAMKKNQEQNSKETSPLEISNSDEPQPGISSTSIVETNIEQTDVDSLETQTEDTDEKNNEENIVDSIESKPETTNISIEETNNINIEETIVKSEQDTSEVQEQENIEINEKMIVDSNESELNTVKFKTEETTSNDIQTNADCVKTEPESPKMVLDENNEQTWVDPSQDNSKNIKEDINARDHIEPRPEETTNKIVVKPEIDQEEGQPDDSQKLVKETSTESNIKPCVDQTKGQLENSKMLLEPADQVEGQPEDSKLFVEESIKKNNDKLVVDQKQRKPEDSKLLIEESIKKINGKPVVDQEERQPEDSKLLVEESIKKSNDKPVVDQKERQPESSKTLVNESTNQNNFKPDVDQAVEQPEDSKILVEKSTNNSNAKPIVDQAKEQPEDSKTLVDETNNQSNVISTVDYVERQPEASKMLIKESINVSNVKPILNQAEEQPEDSKILVEESTNESNVKPVDQVEGKAENSKMSVSKKDKKLNLQPIVLVEKLVITSEMLPRGTNKPEVSKIRKEINVKETNNETNSKTNSQTLIESAPSKMPIEQTNVQIKVEVPPQAKKTRMEKITNNVQTVQNNTEPQSGTSKLVLEEMNAYRNVQIRQECIDSRPGPSKRLLKHENNEVIDHIEPPAKKFAGWTRNKEETPIEQHTNQLSYPANSQVTSQQEYSRSSPKYKPIPYVKHIGRKTWQKNRTQIITMRTVLKKLQFLTKENYLILNRCKIAGN